MNEFLEDYLERMRGQPVAVVGNAPFGADDDHRQFIDDHAYIVRCNNFRDFDGRSGTRLTHWFVNLVLRGAIAAKRVSATQIKLATQMNSGRQLDHIFTPYARGEGGRPSDAHFDRYRRVGLQFIPPKGPLQGSPLLDELRCRHRPPKRIQASIGFQICARLLVHGACVTAVGFADTQRGRFHDFGAELEILQESNLLKFVPMTAIPPCSSLGHGRDMGEL